MAVSLQIVLPNPVVLRPPMSRLGLANLSVNPLSKTASITLVQIDASGNQVPNGETITRSVTAETYVNAAAPLEVAVMNYIVQLLKMDGSVDPETALVATGSAHFRVLPAVGLLTGYAPTVFIASTGHQWMEVPVQGYEFWGHAPTVVIT